MTYAQKVALVKECFENFPEASIGSCLRCVGWNYKKFKFLFVDEETGAKYTVRLRDAMRGLRLLTRAVNEGELPGLGLPAHFLKDSGTWDADSFDALAQMAVFGKVIYG